MDSGNMRKQGKSWWREATRRCELRRKERDVVFSRSSTSGLLLFGLEIVRT